MLRRGGREDGEGKGADESVLGEVEGHDGQGHCHLSGEEVEALARKWGLEICEESWFWTRRRWEEHRKGLEREKREKDGNTNITTECLEWEKSAGNDWGYNATIRPDGTPWPDDDPSWDGHSYLPQGTVGCVVLDSTGTLAVATSTGGLTNKLPGRIGDTPTLGAGFWAEEWSDSNSLLQSSISQGTVLSPMSRFMDRMVAPFPDSLEIGASVLSQVTQCIGTIFRDCLPQLSSSSYTSITQSQTSKNPICLSPPSRSGSHAVAMSGTGNGDSFLRLSAIRTVAALLRFSPASYKLTLQDTVTWMAGPNGELQKSAGSRWGRSGEGQGGIIGIEMRDDKGRVVADFNGGMFRAWVDEQGRERCMVFQEKY